MPVINPDDFATQVAAAVVAGVVVSLLQPQWLLGLFGRKAPPSSSGPTPNRVSNQLTVSDNATLSGNVTQNANYFDLSQRTTVDNSVHNISSPSSAGTGGAIGGQLVLGLFAGLLACAVFLLVGPLLFAAGAGVGAALALMTVAAMWRARLAAQPKGAILPIIGATWSLLIAVVSWRLIEAADYQSQSFADVRAAVQAPISERSALPPLERLTYTGSSLFSMGGDYLVFVLSLLIGFVIAFMGLILAGTLVLEWHSYLRVTQKSAGELTTRRAERFSTRTLVKSLWPLVLIGLLSLALSTGLLVQFTS